MIRVVALKKAALAGAAGALAWEAALRIPILAGIPLFDIVRELGTLIVPANMPLAWWGVGLVAHVLVGIAWTLFYGFFFWARLDVRPALQGLILAAGPAVLAIVIVVPQLRLMHLEQDIVSLEWSSFWDPLSLGVVAGLLLGHAVFGLTAGAIYTHPVGYPVKPESPRPTYATRCTAEPQGSRHSTGSFIFATGVECSYPAIEHGRWRHDQMASAGHYKCWDQDFALARDIGVTHLRYGPPLHLLFTGPGQYDWSLIEEPMAELERHGPEPIIDLCHFGLPGWLGNFQNPEIARALCEYAGAFARQFPWVRFYTPVNEMYVCTRNSTLHGIWNEQQQDEQAFVTAVFNLACSSVAMTDAILKERPDAIFVNSESSEFTQACCPDEKIQRIAEFENQRRFLPLDLIYAHPVSDRMRDYLREHGVEDAEYESFMRRKVPRRSVLGVDYYEWNERVIDEKGENRTLGELFGWHVIANQYYQRYQRTMMHTETNRMDAADAPRWLWRQWHNLQLLRTSGVPLIGFTWYSLSDQVDWHIGMSEALGVVYPVGLSDLNRDLRTVGLAYKHLINMFRDEPEFRECGALVELLR